MYLKIMSPQNAPDDDSRKAFKIFDHVSSAEIVRKSSKAEIEVMFDDESCETFDCPSNAYFMNEQGVTIASFGSAPYRATPA